MTPGPRTLILRIGSLGDTLVSVPALHALHRIEKRPLVLLTTPSAPGLVTSWDVLRYADGFVDVVYYDASRPASMLAAGKRIRELDCDRLYVMVEDRPLAKAARDWLYFRGVCGIRDIRGLAHSVRLFRRLTGESDSFRAPTSRRSGPLPRSPREVDRFLKLVSNTSGQPVGQPKPPFLKPPETVAAKARTLLAPLEGRPLIAWGLGSKMPAKRWFLDRYIEVGRRLATAMPTAGYVLMGAPAERPDSERFAREIGEGRCVDLTGQTDVITSAAVLERCGIYVGNDTGTMHLAATMGCRTVSLFTARVEPGRWEPFGDNNVNLRRAVPCEGCLLEVCVEQKMECLDLITTGDVWAALEPIVRGMESTD